MIILYVMLLQLFLLTSSQISLKYIPYSGLFSRGKIFANARCRVISRGKFSRMVNKELINNHTSI